MRGPLATVALGYAYPDDQSLGRLDEAIAALPSGPVREQMERFLSALSRLDRGAWEELHTRTLDLSPLFVPYVGHLIWGESYRRGAFMAELRGQQRDVGVDPEGELPDHIAPILLYLDRVADPIPELAESLPKAVAAMLEDLRDSEPESPYRHLLAATAAAVDARLAEGADR